METKHCPGCPGDQPVTAFYKNKHRKDGLSTTCKECHKRENREYRARHPERVYQKELAAKTDLKMTVLTAYSPEVKCKCGFTDPRALTIDHIDGNGNAHRREVGRKGTAFYRWLRDNEYPEGFQVLCMNCQWIKRFENGEHNHHR